MRLWIATGQLDPRELSDLVGQRYTGSISFYITEYVAPVDRARNQIVEFFLKPNGELFRHVLMIDSDAAPPVDAIERLISHDPPIVTGLTPIISLNTDDENGETYDNVFEERRATRPKGD